ncbi:MAG: 6-phosphofructokinase [Lachnospiraceae bacterium]|nr:6-phosphofructokinase [Lachnospiraceae bacterium]
MKNCIIAQSGGPTAAINASLAGVMAAAASMGYDNIYGALNGITGILDKNLIELTDVAKNDPKMLNILKQSPAMYLGSCRFKLPKSEDASDVYEKIFATFEEYDISAFFYIGGNDSMDTVHMLSAYGQKTDKPIRIIGVPKTIDNDLCETDHTPGFGSAAKYVATSILEIAHDAYIYDKKSVTIVEIMGRDAGWLTASSVLARTAYSAAPHLIYLPEMPFSKENFIADVKEQLEKHTQVIIAVSEGVRDAEGNYISASSKSNDAFGHVQLNGTGKTLENLLNNTLDVKVRSIELNVLQRSAEHLSSLTDIDESFALGQHAVKMAEDGITACMAAVKRLSSSPYSVTYASVPVEKVANAVKSVPKEWINARGNDVTDALVEYAAPLIVGETQIPYKNGLPVYADISHLLHK